MKNFHYIVIGLLLVIIFILAFIVVKDEIKQPEVVIQPQQQQIIQAPINPSTQFIYSVTIPDTVNFAGEPAPIDLFYMREYLDRELTVNTFWHSSTLMLLKRAHRWFPVIGPILKKHGIPDDFKYLAIIESGLENVTSPAGASGFWQFLKSTAREHGLEVNDNIDERYNIEKSTNAACEYLRESYNKFNNWTLVAASYNAGMKRVSEEIRKQQVNNYYDLFLSSETTRYIYRIHAIKSIFLHPEKYGFFLKNEDLYPSVPFQTITITSSIDNLVNFAKSHGITYKTLKYFNPWLQEADLSNRSGKTYYLKIPLEGYLSYSRLMDQDKVVKNEAADSQNQMN